MAGQGPSCPRCYGVEWQFVEHEEHEERWPLTRGEIIYVCARCGQRGIRSWVDPRATDGERKSFRDNWEFPPPEPGEGTPQTQPPPPRASAGGFGR